MLHIIQNDPEVPPGNLLHEFDVPYSIHHPYRGDALPAVGEIGALIVLGGAMGANDDKRYPFLTEVKMLIREVVGAAIPYLGICLGGQLLAAALGVRVHSHRWEELGSLPVVLTAAGMADQLFRDLPQQFTTFQWHHDSFDLPEGATLLASSPACPHQAFRVGTCAWGIQFHPEVTEKIIRSWCTWDDTTASRVEHLVAAFNKGAPQYLTISRLMRDHFLAPANP